MSRDPSFLPLPTTASSSLLDHPPFSCPLPPQLFLSFITAHTPARDIRLYVYQIFRPPCWKPGFINPFPQNDPDFLRLVTPASRNVQDSLKHCFGLMPVHTKYFLNSPHSVFVHALLRLDSVPRHAAGLLLTVCVTFFPSSAP